jgi:hypothetical protein
VKDKLIVKQVNLKHENHAVDQATYDHYPEKMRLTPEERTEAEKMISVSGNKKKIKMKLMEGRGGKAISMKSLHNVQTKLNSDNKDEVNVMQKIYDMLNAIRGARVKVIVDQHNALVGRLIRLRSN